MEYFVVFWGIILNRSIIIKDWNLGMAVYRYHLQATFHTCSPRFYSGGPSTYPLIRRQDESNTEILVKLA